VPDEGGATDLDGEGVQTGTPADADAEAPVTAWVVGGVLVVEG